MSIKKKISMGLATTALGAMLITGGTMALFTSEASNDGNTFTAGTLTIEDVTGGAAFNQKMYFNNLAPGDSEDATITVENTGSLDAWVKIDAANSVGTGALFTGDTPLSVTLDDAVVLIPAGETADFNVSYSFPLAAGNEYQGATGELDIQIQAVQVRNNVNAAEDGPNSWNENAN